MGSGKTCLIVDDSRVIRRVSQSIMEGLGFTCSEAENGQLAVDACQKAMPDLILLDWNMPVLNGIDALRKLRASPGGDKPIVVFCTTENDFTRIQEGIAAGANEYIMKPFDSDIIRSKLEVLGLIESSM
jgi:two-component system, chemotaxis family, chemotaxis protein CheY